MRYASISVIVTCFLLSSCYTLKQGFTFLGYLRRAQPLEKLSSDAQNQQFVERIADIRAFAVNELGLKNTKNYTRYVEIDRDYLALVVSACAKDSFSPYTWRFPVVGAVPYKGFFEEKDAKTEVEKLKHKDLDVLVRRVDAFSTLGWFQDPLYSYMKNYPIYRLADLIIHESLHTTIYLKGESQFNEELAEFVGKKGSQLYIESRFGVNSSEYQEMMDDTADNETFVDFVLELVRELTAVYAMDTPLSEKLAQKENTINAAQNRFSKAYSTLFKSEGYRFFADLQVNNAYLGLFRLYYGKDSSMEDLFEQLGKDLPSFIAHIVRTQKRQGLGA
ncbi:MAG: aminopeptidase [Treponema sp.]|jgi:predicted aminopeptidase|nr:aminopeptidase [Treponema sp.]